MRKELENKIKAKEQERAELLAEYNLAKEAGDTSQAEGIAKKGKTVRTDLEILRRRLRALELGHPESQVEVKKPVVPEPKEAQSKVKLPYKDN